MKCDKAKQLLSVCRSALIFT